LTVTMLTVSSPPGPQPGGPVDAVTLNRAAGLAPGDPVADRSPPVTLSRSAVGTAAAA